MGSGSNDVLMQHYHHFAEGDNMVIKKKNVSAVGIRAQESKWLPQNSPYGLYGLKATLNSKIRSTELRCSVKVEVAVLGP